jgi:hypothetical protein
MATESESCLEEIVGHEREVAEINRITFLGVAKEHLFDREQFRV